MTFYSKIIGAAAIATGALLMTLPAGAMHHTALERAIDNDIRPAEDRERDEGRKPEAVLGFYGVEEGMTVVDLSSGGGYYTRILSGAVGEDGRVFAQSSNYLGEERINALRAEYAANFPNVELFDRPSSDLGLPDNSVDRVFLVLLYHHWHNDNETGMAPAFAAENYAEIMRVLKPGGIFGIIEHKAVDGTSREQSAAWHRATEQNAMDDLTSAGFEFAGSSDILVNEGDDMSHYWREGTVARGFTTRFVHAYRKPN